MNAPINLSEGTPLFNRIGDNPVYLVEATNGPRRGQMGYTTTYQGSCTVVDVHWSDDTRGNYRAVHLNRIQQVSYAGYEHDIQLYRRERDRVTRNRPSAEAVRHAVALLKAEPCADLAVIPMYWPGKRAGWWVDGQEVCTVRGVVLIGINSSSDVPASSCVPCYSWARDQAALIAARGLGERPGVSGWAVVDRRCMDDPEAVPGVFED